MMRRVIFCSCAIAIASVGNAELVSTDWIGGVGVWNEAANWSAGEVPDNSDDVEWRVTVNDADASVALNEEVSLSGLLLRNGKIRVQDGGIDLTTTPSGSSLFQLAPARADLAASMVIDGVGSYVLATTRNGLPEDSSIGTRAFGQLDVINGGRFESVNAVVIGGGKGSGEPIDGPDGHGVVTVDGPGSTFVAAGDVMVGRGGVAELSVTNGALLEAGRVFAGDTLTHVRPSNPGSAVVVVNGSGTRLRTRHLSIGEYSSGGRRGDSSIGEVHIEEGGVVESTENAYVSTFSMIELRDGSLIAQLFANRGTVFGQGLIAADVENRSEFSLVSSQASLVVEGAFEQKDSGFLTLLIDGIAPAAPSPLKVEGHATLSGQVQVAREDGVTSQLGDSYSVMEYESFSGTMSVVDEALTPGLAWAPNYGESGLGITLALIGDANQDGAVDLEDFNALKDHFGESEVGWSRGDFNSDGGVDLVDFSQLKEHFGNTAASVPEPSSASLVIASLLGSLYLSRRKSIHGVVV